MSKFELIMRPGVNPYEAPGKPPLPGAEYWRGEELGVLVERNVAVTLRDKTRIYIDVYRPSGKVGERDLPTLLAWSPYGKHWRSNKVYWPASGVDPSWLSPLTPFEAPDPVFWTEAGYAVAVADPRGAWLSEGDFFHNGPIEAEDCLETIQWLAAQPWSNGKVGMSGVSYLACIQYLVASRRPPALAALNPWEGFSDWYREFTHHGGIPETGFVPRASDNIRFSLGRTENTLANVRAHPLYDDYWKSKELDLGAIETPAYIVASWTDQGFHTRGTLEVFRRIASREKWLEVHGQKKWANYYLPESRRKQRTFFDHFLKVRGTAVPTWPRVRLEVRERAGVAAERIADEWPLPQTEYRAFWLNCATGLLNSEPIAERTSIRYDSRAGRATFDYLIDADTEITGYSKLRVWLSAEGAEDADVFVALQKIGSDGEQCGMMFYAFYENGPVALGWLRASHRALDPSRSTPWQPVHPHDAEQKLPHGRPVALDIEIWPSSTLFRAGETLRLVIQGSDIYKESLPNLPFARHEDTRNGGTHTLWAGGEYDAHLLLPIISG